MPVDALHPDYKRMIGKWRRCRDVACGQDAVHGAGTAYLPKLAEQSAKDYLGYVLRATFYNATWRTISGLKGMIFRKPPIITAPESVKPYFEDVTMAGEPLPLFMQDCVEEAIKIGRVGMLVDYPDVNAVGMTEAQAKALNLRPTLQSYYAEDIINWKIASVNNRMVLQMVVLMESHAEPADEYQDTTETRYRVLDLVQGVDETGAAVTRYRVRMYKKDKKADILISTAFPMLQGKSLDFIPFLFMGTDDVTPEVDDPPLIDLVDLNLAHYRVSADYEHGCHFTGLPTAWVAGYKKEDNEKLYIGAQTAWVFSNENAKAAFLEFTGQGLTSLRDNLKDKEQRMAVLGARMLEEQKKAPEAADSASIRRKGEESMLSAAAKVMSLGFTTVIKWFTAWAGADAATASIELNDDFYPILMTPQMLTAMLQGWQMGAPGFSDQGLFDNLQAAGLIDEDTTLEDEQARKNTAPPKIAVQPAGGNAPAPAGGKQPAPQGA